MLGYIALGGVLGTVARFGLQGWVQGRFGAGATILGSLLAVLAGLFLANQLL